MFDFYSLINNFADEIIKHCIEQYPKEACGVIRPNRFEPVENTNALPNRHFSLGTITYEDLNAEDDVIGVIHSHTNGNLAPSPHDQQSCNQTRVPWAIFVIPQKQFVYLDPQEDIIALCDRPWSYGVLDCCSIVVDTYKDLGIPIKDFPRPELYAWNQDANWNQYRDILEKEGFEEVFSPQPYDVIAMSCDCMPPSRINHCGIWLGNNTFVHHCINRISGIATWGGYWKNSTLGFWRHPNIENRWTQTIKLH